MASDDRPLDPLPKDPEPDTGFTTLERVFLFWLAVLTFLVVIALVVK